MANSLPRGVRGIAFRVGKRLDRAAVARAHDVLYLSDAWTDTAWLGAQALKNPLDLWVYQEIMFETKPELVVETGTYQGGSAFFLATMCDVLGAGEVVSIDIEPLRDDYPAHPRITYLGGRSDQTYVETDVGADGCADRAAVERALDGETAALIVGYPSFFGGLADLRALAELAHARGALLVVATSEPYALAVAESPGAQGAAAVPGFGSRSSVRTDAMARRPSR